MITICGVCVIITVAAFLVIQFREARVFLNETSRFIVPDWVPFPDDLNAEAGLGLTGQYAGDQNAGLPPGTPGSDVAGDEPGGAGAANGSGGGGGGSGGPSGGESNGGSAPAGEGDGDELDGEVPPGDGGGPGGGDPNGSTLPQGGVEGFGFPQGAEFPEG